MYSKGRVSSYFQPKRAPSATRILSTTASLAVRPRQTATATTWTYRAAIARTTMRLTVQTDSASTATTTTVIKGNKGLIEKKTRWALSFTIISACTVDGLVDFGDQVELKIVRSRFDFSSCQTDCEETDGCEWVIYTPYKCTLFGDITDVGRCSTCITGPKNCSTILLS